MGLRSLGEMIQDLDTVRDTKADTLNEWAFNFIEDMMSRSDRGRVTLQLSSTEAEKVAELWREHFR